MRPSLVKAANKSLSPTIKVEVNPEGHVLLVMSSEDGPAVIGFHPDEAVAMAEAMIEAAGDARAMLGPRRLI